MADFKPGDRVEHASFGPGTLLERNEQHTTVHFDAHGRKKLATALVTLTLSEVPEKGQERRSPWTLPRRHVPPPPPAPVASARVSIEEVMQEASRRVNSAESFHTFVSEMRRSLPGPSHQHLGLLSGMRVQEFQHWQLDQNSTYRLTDAQLLAVMRLEFPLASGVVFMSDLDTGLQHIAGIRAHYNRLGHNAAASREMAPSVSYGVF